MFCIQDVFQYQQKNRHCTAQIQRPVSVSLQTACGRYNDLVLLCNLTVNNKPLISFSVPFRGHSYKANVYVIGFTLLYRPHKINYLQSKWQLHTDSPYI